MATTINIMGDSPEFCTGDVTLISSDRWRFRVPGHVLAWASPVFAEMLSLSSQSSQSSQSPPSQSPNAGGAGRVHLELESDFEDAGTVRRFLVLVTEQRFDGPGFPSRSGFFSSWRPALHALLRLLDKWGCERGVAALRALGGALVVRGELVWSDALVFGAMLNDLAMCRDVVARFARNTVHHPRCGALPTSTAGADAGAAAADDDDDDDKTRIRILYGDECAPMFLLGAAPFELSCALPQAYQFALVHASLHHDLGSDDPEDADDFADTFVAAATYALQLQRREPEKHTPIPAFPNIVSEPVLRRKEYD